MVDFKEIGVKTQKRSHWVDITSEINTALRFSSVQNGIVTVSSVHTTAGLTINENADPDVGRDFFWKLNQLVPQENAYHHMEGNSDSHVKASLVGFSVQVPVRDGKLILGTWQSIYFCEFDGPRNRRVMVTIQGE